MPLQVRVLAVDDRRRRIEVTQKSDEERELDKAFDLGVPVTARDTPDSAGGGGKNRKGNSGAPEGALASALALAGVQVSM